MKSKRDITLGEMQDECKRVGGICLGINDLVVQCKFIEVCPNRCEVETRPSKWVLTDPPRFSDEAMAFFKWWYDRGAKKAINVNSYEFGAITVFEDKNERQIGNAQEYSIIAEVKKNGNQIDLAELLEKDGARR